MKKIKLFTAVLAAVAALVLLPDQSATTVKAEEPATYSVQYVSEEEGWRYTEGSSFEGYHREVYYLRDLLKDGDQVVVYNEIPTNEVLDLGSVHLSNLTVFINSAWSIVKAGSIDDCYALAGSSSSVSGGVTNAYVYDNALCNFNNDVSYLTLYYDEELMPTIGGGGKVGQLIARHKSDPDWLHYSVHYNFAANTLKIEEGNLLTSEQYYSLEPVAIAQQTTAPAASGSDSEYDDVPKTGQNSLYLWLLLASAACLAGSYTLERSSR